VVTGSRKPAWTGGHVRISESAFAVVEQAAKAAYGRDEESCGFLTGPASDELLADQAVELENLANKYHRLDPEAHPRTGRQYFKVNSLKFERSIEEGQKSGRPVKVFFHSHLDVGAYFSSEDAASMTMGGGDAPTHELAYLVTAVDAGQITAHKLFVWDPPTKTFVEAPFHRLVPHRGGQTPG
jgi:proteasome lid subunit RPN8/RPN11